MSAEWFVDTNVLVYARDASEPRKQPLAQDWLRREGMLLENVRVVNPFVTPPPTEKGAAAHP